MKNKLLTALALTALVLPAAAQTQNPKPGEVMYVTPAEVTKFTAKVVDGVSTHFMVKKDTYGQELVYRTASGVPEVHRDWADHFVVIEGAATLVLGGWGGALVGISSIDDQDASENSTRSEQHFINGKWYRVRLEITNDELKAWIDDRLVVNTSIKGRKISLRPGDIEHCAPFGFATYASEGQVRGLRLRRL